jgi:hypothetical protein
MIFDLVNALRRLPPEERPELVLVIPSSCANAIAEHARLLPLVDQIIEVGFPDVGRRHAGLLVVRDFDELFKHIDFLYPARMMALPGRPVATWIPDFEHHRLAMVLTPDECAFREERYRALADQADLVVLNSHVARRDWRDHYPAARAIVRVLPVRSAVEPAWLTLDPAAVALKHGLTEPFLFCANPFWVHKGHSALVDAVAHMVETGAGPPLIACAGSLDDRRFPGIFQVIRARMEAAGVADRFRILGPVPRDERIALMRRSLAVLQPSKFEGWSLIVEEARALGKTILLSDIETHREQTPPRGHLYYPGDVVELARILGELLPTMTPGPNLEDEQQAGRAAEEAALRYARAVCALAGEAASIGIAVRKAAAVSLSSRT